MPGPKTKLGPQTLHIATNLCGTCGDLGGFPKARSRGVAPSQPMMGMPPMMDPMMYGPQFSDFMTRDPHSGPGKDGSWAFRGGATRNDSYAELLCPD